MHLKKTFKIVEVNSGDLIPSSFFVDNFYKILSKGSKIREQQVEI